MNLILKGIESIDCLLPLHKSQSSRPPKKGGGNHRQFDETLPMKLALNQSFVAKDLKQCNLKLKVGKPI